MKRDTNSISNTIIVAVSLCLVCSAIVSVTAVGLRKMQTENKLLDMKKNILAAAGLMEDGGDVNDIFEARVTDIIIDLDTGEDVTDQYENPGEFDQFEAAESNDKTVSDAIKSKEDIAVIKSREKHSHVYIVKTSETDDTPLYYVFPIRGKGLWSILRGFIALESDLNTIRGLTYYSHGETPGLGGEVDNPEWKSHWVAKELFNADGAVAMRLVKADWEDNPNAVDSLSGATITARGVENMLIYWMGDSGFGPYIDSISGASAPQNNSSAGASGG